MSSRRRSSSSVRTDLLELCRHLRQEKLYVQHEKGQLQELNDKVKLSAEKLAHVAWVTREQRENLGGLIFSSRGADNSPAVCCQRANLLEQTQFQDAYKHLNYQEIIYSEFLRNLRDKPKLLASCLAAGDKGSGDSKQTSEVISTVFSGLYGCCVMQDDEQLVLQMLHHLMKLQLSAAPNPRKLLRQGNCAFSRLYKTFHEELFSAKLFLTSSLYEPILNLLSEDEIFLDIDPSKAIIRFPPQERLKKFGKEDSPEFQDRLKEHREFIIGKLESITNRFIHGIRSNLHCFPPSLARLLRKMYSLLMASGQTEPRDVNAVCVDVVFDLFICPAMVDPNPVGIIDTPISYIARSNLMQVAQILQVLALWKWEDIDPKLMDLYSRFDKEAMSSVLETMLKAGEVSDEDEEGEEAMKQHPSIHMTPEESNLLSRSAVLMTRYQLENLIAFLRSVKEHESDLVDINELETLLATVPENLPQPNKSQAKALSLSPSKSDDSNLSSESSSRTRKQVLASKLSNVANSVANSAKNKRSTDSEDANSFEEHNGLMSREPETVLVIPIVDSHSSELPGFISEEQVLTRNRQVSRVVGMNLENLPGGGASGSEENSSFLSGAVGEKRTRFSISHDEGSIGNTSDNLEAISEAASNHSVDSSMEDEGEQADEDDPIIDNLSDMVSANVSGRGTPSVSGRGTPSSQVTEGGGLGGRGAAVAEQNGDEPQEEEEQEGNANQNNVQEVQRNVPVPRQNPPGGGRKNGEPDLEEKFGRFEIKPPPNRRVQSHMAGGFSSEQGDETVSMISDTWSTDVLASDTETLGENDNRSAVLEDLVRNNGRDRNRLLDELAVPPTPGGGNSLASASASNLLDVAETASEAWSIDVLASDSESLRLGELDNEDSASVARSDDTRFTDDTGRSDPDPGLDASVSSMYSGQGSFKGRREVDVTMLKRGGQSAEASVGNPLRPSRAAAVEQWARQSSGSNSNRPLPFLPRRGSDSAGLGVVDTSNKGSKKYASNENSILKRSQPNPVVSTSTPTFNQASVTGHRSNPLPVNGIDEVTTPGASGAGASAGTMSSHLSGASIASSGSSCDVSQEVPNPTKVKPGVIKLSNVDQSKPNLAQSLLDTDNPIVIPSTAASNVTRSAPNSATGAIPKSISFDKTVYDSGSFDSNDQHIKLKGRDRNSFFKGFKLPKIGNKGSGGRSNSHRNALAKSDEHIRSSERMTGDETFHIPEDTEGRPQQLLRRDGSDETSDDILAKYRKKTIADSAADSDNVDAEVVDIVGANGEPDERLVIDPNNIEGSYAFQDAKRKLRLMLSGADPSVLAKLPSRAGDVKEGRQVKEENEILWFLRVQLAEAYNLQDRNMVAQLHETLRCVSLFDAEGCRKLLKNLKDDYKKRTPYLSYLVRCRQGLLTALSEQQRLLSRMEVDQKVCSQYLVSVCMRLFLEQRERKLQNFVSQFKETSVADERVALMEKFLSMLWKNLDDEPSWALVANEEQMLVARITIERTVFSHIYMHAMFPNGDGDISRDAVLAEHIQKLSSVITPGHRDLRIPRQYHYEAPWPSAQEEIRRLAAYKTASDKVSCVVRCSQTIMNLLSLSSSKSVPAADDFVPVMVFVLIKANPPSLLSTVQYVDSFYGSRLSGEDQYWWMQFAAAIEFIKTMDYQIA